MQQTRTSGEAADGRIGGPLLHVRDLRTHFLTDPRLVKAVDGVDFSVSRGRCLCLVGESGSGKSVTARSILGLIDPPGKVVGGQILWSGDGEQVDLATFDPVGEDMRRLRGNDIAMVFQEPMASLSPMYTVGAHLVEAIRIHKSMSKKEAFTLGVDLLDRVGIQEPAARMSAYPFQLSGGMCQRVMIAMALSCDPKLLIADEPTTALDVTTQARIIRLLRDLQQERELAMLFITHDFGVVAEIADEVAVMRKGHVVETGYVDDIFHATKHEYTRQLLDALPTPARARTATPALTEPSRPVRLADYRTPGGADEPDDPPLISVRSLDKRFPIRGSGLFARVSGYNDVLNGIDLDIRRGEVLGLVGESGSGKTTLGRCIIGVHRPERGQVHYQRGPGEVVDIAHTDGHTRKMCQREIRMVFQDPFGSLNPRMSVLQIIGDPLVVNKIASGSELEDRVAEMLTRVGLPKEYMRRYPHAFSGGERQRIGIARALIVDPTCVIADEAVSGLDMSVRAQILELLAQLKDEFNLTYLFISHDLSVVESICDRVAVMFKGDLVELADTAEIFTRPRSDYTRELLAAAPVPDPRLRSA